MASNPNGQQRFELPTSYNPFGQVHLVTSVTSGTRFPLQTLHASSSGKQSQVLLQVGRGLQFKIDYGGLKIGTNPAIQTHWLPTLTVLVPTHKQFPLGSVLAPVGQPQLSPVALRN